MKMLTINCNDDNFLLQNSCIYRGIKLHRTVLYLVIKWRLGEISWTGFDYVETD